jgi:uncharacterized protein
MRIDCHVHVSACVEPDGCMSPRLMRSGSMRFMRWWFSLRGQDAATQQALADLLSQTIDQTPELDAAVILAFDAVYDRDGRRDHANTHLYVSNDYVRDLAQRHDRMLFGASVHPYRRDAVAELERCAAAGAVLVKWLPIVQDIDPTDERCLPFYEALAALNLPLLSHTGGETALPNLNKAVASPALLEPALKRGVKVIAAHCGTRSALWQRNYLDEFARMAHQHEHFYGDTSALNLPTRWDAYKLIERDPLVRGKLVHGSDWPILSIPPLPRLGLRRSLNLMRQHRNWMRRDVLIKQALGLFDDAYWHRAAKVLSMGDL